MIGPAVEVSAFRKLRGIAQKRCRPNDGGPAPPDRREGPRRPHFPATGFPRVRRERNRQMDPAP